MLDLIAMTTLLIVMIIFGFFLFLAFCIIIISDQNKSDFERELEDEEQMNYLKSLEEKKIYRKKLPKNLTKIQAISYAVVALHTLKVSPNNITEKELADEILVIMQLHNKHEICQRANKILYDLSKNP